MADGDGTSASGSGVSVRSDGSRARPLRVVSFNARRLTQRESRRANEVGAMLRALAPDVCALQEIASECTERGALAQVAKSVRLGHVTFEPHAPLAARGVGLLHRHAALASSGGRLPARAGDDKGFTRAVLALGLPATPEATLGGAVEVIAVHLDPFSRDARRRQITLLADAVGRRSMPRIVLGDFNAMTVGAWLSRSVHDDTVAAMAEALELEVPTCSWPRTFPSRYPMFAIDWVLTSSELEVCSAECVATRLSDHAALLTEIALQTPLTAADA